MKNVLRVAAGIIVSALCAAACTGTTEGDDDDDSIARESVATAYANGMCNALATCCKSLGQPMNTQACIEQVEASYGSNNDPALLYDEKASAECLAAGTAAYQQCRSVEAPVCDRVWTGYLEDGEPCDEDSVCKGGACGFEVNATNSTCFTRPPAPALGEPCESACADGAYCDPASLTCAATKPHGAACRADDECTGRYCNFSTGRCDEAAIFATLCSAFGGSVITEPFCCALDELCASCGCAESNQAIASSNEGDACQLVIESDDLGCTVTEDDALSFCL